MNVIKKLLRAVLPAKRRRRISTTTKRELLVRLLREHLQAETPERYEQVADMVLSLMRISRDNRAAALDAWRRK